MDLAKFPVTESLHGSWRFALDKDDVGVEQKWYSMRLGDTIVLPGILQEQGYGDEVTAETEWASSLHDPLWYLRDEYIKYAQPGNIKVPFWLQPKKHYRGAAWYQREIVVPESWRGSRISLTLERVNWVSSVWLDDRELGSSNSLSVPHYYDLGVVEPGTYTLTIRVDNRLQMDVRPDGHSMTDSIGSTWNGIIGRIDLTASSPVWIKQADVYPDIKTKSALVQVEIGNSTGKSGQGKLVCGETSQPIRWDESGGRFEVLVSLGDNAELWDEFNPKLHQFVLELQGESIYDACSLTIGIRELRTEGTQFVLNNRPVHFRGTHDAGAFPLTGYPAMDVEAWKQIFQVCKDHGLNHVRYHSFCPPKAAFIAADQIGIYLQVECSIWTWLNPGTEVEAWLYEETERILREYGNHPSFVLLSHGNEPLGLWKEVLPNWLKHFKEKDSRRLYCMQTGRQDRLNPDEDYYEHWNNEYPEQDYLVMGRIGYDRLRGPSVWNGSDFRSVVERLNVPVLTHEIGQWCSFPKLDDVEKYTGHLQAKNYEIYLDLLKENGLLDQAEDFLLASGKLQALCYKEEIEANLRTPGIGGFQLLDLRDYPGQGTALVGVLNVFWESKGYITAEEFRRFCSETVPLARFTSRVFTTGDIVKIPIDVYHYGAEPLKNAKLTWKVLRQDGTTAAEGEFPVQDIPLGSGIPVNEVELSFADWEAPAQYKLMVSFADLPYENDWAFWVYPDDKNEVDCSEVFVTDCFDDTAAAKLEDGEKVLYFAAQQLSWEHPPFSFYPIFWNRLMNPGWQRSLGILCDPEHPALIEFPTDYHADFQWKDILNHQCRAVDLNLLHDKLEPIVWGIDDWNRSLKLGLIFECRVGSGKLLICSADLQTDLESRPGAKQLLKSLIRYMNSDKFKPKVELSVQDLEKILFPTQIMPELGARITADAEGERFGTAERLIDGDPNTFWISGWRDDAKSHPHSLTIEFEREVPIAGLVVMQTQHDRLRRGHIKDYRIEMSSDGREWINVKESALKSSFKVQKIYFDKVTNAKYLKFTSLSGFGGDRVSALAELAVIYAGRIHGRTGRYGFTEVRTESVDIDDPTAAGN